MSKDINRTKILMFRAEREWNRDSLQRSWEKT